MDEERNKVTALKRRRAQSPIYKVVKANRLGNNPRSPLSRDVTISEVHQTNTAGISACRQGDIVADIY